MCYDFNGKNVFDRTLLLSKFRGDNRHFNETNCEAFLSKEIVGSRKKHTTNEMVERLNVEY